MPSRVAAGTAPNHVWTCYLVHDASGRWTYVGKTNNLVRRLRQHNGGAKATRGRGPLTLGWYITGFVCEADALRFEWRMHHPPLNLRRRGYAGRLEALAAVCLLERWTVRSPAARDTPLRVHVRTPVPAPADVDALRVALATCPALTLVERPGELAFH